MKETNFKEYNFSEIIPILLQITNDIKDVIKKTIETTVLKNYELPLIINAVITKLLLDHIESFEFKSTEPGKEIIQNICESVKNMHEIKFFADKVSVSKQNLNLETLQMKNTTIH